MLAPALGRRTPRAVARRKGTSLWSPAAEIAGGMYAWEASAGTAPTLDEGTTRLMDRNGGPITLSAQNATPANQPVWLADAGDGMPALEFQGISGAMRLIYANPLTIETESLFYLVKPTAAGQFGTDPTMAMGYGNEAGTFQIQTGTVGEFRANVAGTAPVPNLTSSPATNYLGQWMTGVLEMDPVAGQMRHWINGVQVASGAYAPGGPVTHARWTLGGSRWGGNSVPMHFAHGFVLHSVGADTRAKGTAYLKRLWGSRVQGW